MNFLSQPTLASKVGWAVYGLFHRGGVANELMWPYRKPPPPDLPLPTGVRVHKLRAFNADGTEVPSRLRPLPDWAAALPYYAEADVHPAAMRLLCCVLQELVKELPEEACKRIWDAHGEFLGIDPGDAAQLAGYAYKPAVTPVGER